MPIAADASSPSKQAVPQPRKRGRKPQPGGSSTRAARESARKANHSRIEKARRLKINGALDELRTLVPPNIISLTASIPVQDKGTDNIENRDDEDDEEDDKDDDGDCKSFLLPSHILCGLD